MRDLKNNQTYSDLPLIVSKRPLDELLSITEKKEDEEKRTVVRRAGSGKLSKLAKDVGEFAKNNPDSLMQALHILEYKPSDNKRKTIAAIFNKIITSKIEGDTHFQYLFDSAQISDDKILLKVVEYSCDDGQDSVVAVNARTCGSIVRSILYAMATSKNHSKIEWDESKGDKVEISYQRKEKIVIITATA